MGKLVSLWTGRHAQLGDGGGDTRAGTAGEVDQGNRPSAGTTAHVATAGLHQLGLLQALLDPGVGALTAVLTPVALVEVLNVPTLVASLVEHLEADHLFHRRLAVPQGTQRAASCGILE